MLASIVVEVNNHKLDQPYSYLVDFSMQKNIKIGQKVIVPFNNRNVEGFVLDLQTEYETNDKLKNIISLEESYLNEEQLQLVSHLRKSNVATMIECINTLLPPALRASIKNNECKKYVKCLKVTSKDDLNEKEQTIIDYLESNVDPTLKKANELYGTYIINKLRKNNKIEVYECESYRSSMPINELNYYDQLTSEQTTVVDDIVNSDELFHLIYGKTGSGKTVCYLELVKKCLEDNKEVLLLVPEISLTTQLVNILSYHFKDDIAVFHSKMSSAERYDQFRKIIDKKVSIAIGTRSSIFLPFENIGLIVIDEEHDDSYIQESKVSYSTKEIAFLRAIYHNAKLILGSATPDVVTYHSALNNKISLHKLANNYSESNVTTNIVDMKSNFDWIISQELETKIRESLDSSHQFILLLNRRGYANYLICDKCGEVLKCPNCDVTLNLHNSSQLKCHHCNYSTYNKNCTCGSGEFSEYGYGLQKVEEVLNEKFSDLKIARVDTDVMNKQSEISKVFDMFKNQEYDGLIGTQILSKGLNFTNVNLVAIIDADYMLNINSYKASERTFQYITQSLGRNARGSSKECINLVQSYDIDHYAFTTAIENDYDKFYNKEIAFRKDYNYPPFTKYSKVFATSNNLSTLVKVMNEIHNLLVSNDFNATKPHFSNIEKINNQYRIQILVKHSHFTKFFGIINKIRLYNRDSDVSILINNFPIDF